LTLGYRIDFSYQSADGLANQLASHPKDIPGDKDRYSGINARSTREHNQTQSQDDPKTGQTVGE
jgi:hypothetical protein